jgi:thymidine phosphorylase
MNTYQIGMASLELGAGRKRKEDKIDYKAGIIFNKKIGDYLNKEDTICQVYSDSKTKLKTAEEMILNSIIFSKTKSQILKLIKKVIL